MPPDGPMPPQGRMIVAAMLALFFGAFAAGSLHSAGQDYRWRNATVVRGVMVKRGDDYHYEYRPPGKAVVAGRSLGDQASSKPDGVVDDWARLEYDPNLPEQLRRHWSKGRASTNFRQFLIETAAGAAFSAIVLACVWAFLKAWYDKRSQASG